jgi:polysaccharide export outer membrane protein
MVSRTRTIIEVIRSLILFILLVVAARSGFAQATLRVGDPVEIRIGGVPQEEQLQVNNTYTVDTNGAINLPYINRVRAQGMTPAQLARSIEQTYRANKIYSNPTVTIIMQPTARFVNVGGAVRSPARIPFTEDITLLAAINAAGGFNDFADQKKVRLLRGNEVRVFDIRQFRRDPSLDVRLQPGDRVEVPQTFF